ncbi:MAG: hypothetical protein II194_08880 [Bacteroidales bacterium]|nr:hypothetical protein [Bacteroidales bacterium]MBQ2113316.1 hypothetical protein [Bacteroidales bacterium]
MIGLFEGLGTELIMLLVGGLIGGRVGFRAGMRQKSKMKQKAGDNAIQVQVGNINSEHNGSK